MSTAGPPTRSGTRWAAEPVEPAEPPPPAGPAPPVESVERPAPAAPVESVEPVERPAPAAPVESVEPVERPAPAAPVESVEPVEPVEPVERVRPMPRLTTRTITTTDELVEHFDRAAPAYVDTHGHAARLLAYRLGIIRRLLGRAAARGVLLEIGCGKAIHLIPLAGDFDRAVGCDISPEMVRIARIAAAASASADRIELTVDPAEDLASIADGSVDAVLCVGALEHMLDRPRVLAQVHRVLRVGGSFVCLTPNGRYCWYTALAPRLGLDTRHLSTDRFLTPAELDALVRDARLTPDPVERWRFIPKGDVPPAVGHLLHGLDLVGAATGAGSLRGGLALRARRVD